jgi:NADPH:quinone reductase-like Zn-dependent oxidoreductase
MRALRLYSSASRPLLVQEETPRPEPQVGEILVRVRAVAVTPSELLWRATSHTAIAVRGAILFSAVNSPERLRSAAR